MKKTIRWGILGTGAIARKFALGLSELEHIELTAVGSRNQASADNFADMFGIATRYASYEALVNDPVIDVVYIGTPHQLHKENTLLCLEAGKAVLCEKPFALNEAQAKEMTDAARNKGLFLMEAVWSRFLPHMVKVRELLSEGAIGEPRMLQADFGFRTEVNPEGRLFDLSYGGGALLDVGIYPVNLAIELFGEPADIKSFANLGQTGVDEEASILFKHSSNQLSLLSTAIRLTTPHEAVMVGTEGRIHIHHGWWRPTNFTLYKEGQEAEVFEIDCPLNGYNYEALEVAQCIREGKLESDVMPLRESLATLRTLDKLREQWGLRYPGDQE